MKRGLAQERNKSTCKDLKNPMAIYCTTFVFVQWMELMWQKGMNVLL